MTATNGSNVRTPTSELQNLLQSSLETRSPEELAPLAEMMAQQAREARLANPGSRELLQLEVRYLELAVEYARSLKNSAHEAALLENLAELVPGKTRAHELRLNAAAAYTRAGQPDAATRIYHEVASADDLRAKLNAGIGSAAIKVDHEQDPERSLAIVEGLIDQASAAGLKALHLRLALVRTRFFIQMGRPDAAEDSILLADRLGEDCPDSEYRLLVKAVAAHVWSKQARFKRAINAAAELLQTAQDDPHWTEIQEHAGCVFANCGLHSRARKVFEAITDAYHAAGDRFGKARVELYIARLLIDEGRYEQAGVPLSLAESEFKALGREHWLGFTLLGNVEILMGLGRMTDAERELRKARLSPAVMTSRLHTACAHEMAGDMLRHGFWYREALREYTLARDVARDAGLMREAARNALNCSHIHYLLGRPAPAETQAVLSIALLGHDWEYALVEYIEAHAALTRIYLKRGRSGKARAALVEALEAADNLDLLEEHSALRAQVLITDLKRLEQQVAAAEKNPAMEE